MDNKTEKWHSQDEIIQFIHLATRWKINAVFKIRTDKILFLIDYDIFC